MVQVPLNYIMTEDEWSNIALGQDCRHVLLFFFLSHVNCFWTFLLIKKGKNAFIRSEFLISALLTFWTEYSLWWASSYALDDV